METARQLLRGTCLADDPQTLCKLSNVIAQMHAVKRQNEEMAERLDNQTEAILDRAATAKTHVDAAIEQL